MFFFGGGWLRRVPGCRVLGSGLADSAFVILFRIDGSAFAEIACGSCKTYSGSSRGSTAKLKLNENDPVGYHEKQQ